MTRPRTPRSEHGGITARDGSGVSPGEAAHAGSAGSSPPGVGWPELRRLATEAATHAYAPYSQLAVGAAGVDAGGQVLVGCNVENASYGLTLCAECGLVSALHASGGHQLVRVSVVASDGHPLAPCGRCRQLLYEAGGGELELDSDTGPLRLAELLPGAFGPDDLTRRTGSENPREEEVHGS